MSEETTTQQVRVEKLLTSEDPIFGPPIVINLDKDEKRWADMCEHLAQWNIVPERFSALSGYTLPSIPEHMKNPSYLVSLNLTHAAVSRHCLLNTQRRMWLVLEDDCRFLEDPRNIVVNATRTLQQAEVDWSVISFGCYSYDWQAKRVEIDYSQSVLDQPVGWYPWGSHSYLVNRNHAYRLIGSWSTCISPPDHLLLNEYKAKNGYLVRPSATYQEEYKSYHAGGNSTTDTKRSADLPEDVIERIVKISPNV